VDQVGASSAKIHSVQIVSKQLLKNTGFEDGVATPWYITPGVLQNNAAFAHSGSWYTEIGNGGTGTHTDKVSQIVTLPTGTSASLSFYLNVATTETTTTAVHDHLDVDVYGSDNTTLLATLASYSNLDTTTGYVQHTFDMTPYLGQKITVKFIGVNNSTLQTTWDLDDVGLHLQ